MYEKATMTLKFIFCMVIGLGILTSGLRAASAMELKKPKNPSAPLASYLWYDGAHERKIWLDTSLAVEFDPDPSGKNAFLKAYPKAEAVDDRRAGVRFWKLHSGTDAREAVTRLKSVNPAGRYSPVLHDSPSDSGRMRALPGNVIVYLNPGWDATAVKAWADSRRLEIVQKLEIGPNVYVIKTGPGLESLETANALYQSGEVISAFPNWWQEAVTR